VHLDPGRLVTVGPAALSTGGVVTNTGLALHRLGVEVQLVGKVGDDLFGESVRRSLAQAGLADHIGVAIGQATSYTIVVSPPGVDRSFLHCPGVNESFGAGDVPYERLGDARVFHFGYPPLMPRMYTDGGRELLEMLSRVRASGPATSLDMCALDPDSDAGQVDWRVILANCLPSVDIFCPSLEELLYMLDRPAHERFLERGLASVDAEQLRALSESIISMGSAVAMIKLGDHGLYVRASSDSSRITRYCDRLGLTARDWIGREVLAPCFTPRSVVGTTGSGDATVAGFLAALLRGAGPADAATAATAVGACSVEAIDPTSGIPSWSEIESRIADGWPRRETSVPLGASASARQDCT
jgi:sugar/nucleoside kinase (ribokinase family)